MLQGEDVDQILEVTKGYFCSYEAFLQGVPYGQKEYVEDPARFGATPYAVQYIQSTRQGVEDIHAFIREHREELDGLDLIVRDEQDRLSLQEKLAACGRSLYITSSVPNRIELTSPEAGKASGLCFLLERLGIRRRRRRLLGDADNDIDMLKVSGCGIAVANATEGCKAAADCLTKSNQEDGVAYGIREILGIRAGGSDTNACLRAQEGGKEMRIHGFQTLTLLDYPGLLACTIFLGHCNFRCPFCQNGNLVLHPEEGAGGAGRRGDGSSEKTPGDLRRSLCDRRGADTGS